jgi:hypothetical protein
MRNRQIFSSEGIPYPDEDVHRLEKTFEQEVMDREKDPRLEAALDRIKFETLREIFTEHAQRCGIRPEDVNFISRERIFAGAPRGAAGFFDTLKNTIGIKPPPSIFGSDLSVLHVLSHEETHAVSRSEEFLDLEVDEEAKKIDIGRASSQTGYNRFTEKEDLFRYFNEGVVERFSRQITKEYLDRDRNFAPKEEKQAFLALVGRFGGYGRNVGMVEAIIRKISSEAGVSEDLVWQGFIRGLFEGEKLDNPELEAEFNSIFKEGFMDKLKDVKGLGDYADLMAMIDGPSLQLFVFKILGMEVKALGRLGEALGKVGINKPLDDLLDRVA